MQKLFITIYSIFITIIFTRCSPDDKCYINYYQNITDYQIMVNLKTPQGIKVDTSGYNIDLKKLDLRINTIEKCIQQVAKDVFMLPLEQKAGWQCIRNMHPDEKLKRDCLVIKVVKPTLSDCSNWQFIGVKAPTELCLAKGVIPTKECPCMWRTAIQDENIIITPPDIYLWEIGRIMTSCNNIWVSPYAKCLTMPSPKGESL